MTKAKYIPKDYHSITPLLVMDDASRAIEFYKRAFNAQEMFRKELPDGKIMHATIKIGDSIIMLADECELHEGHEENCCRPPTALHGTTMSLYLYVEDVDHVFNRALEAGAESVMAVDDMFWGDRMGMLKDPFGHLWSVATQKEILSPEEIDKRSEEFMAARK